MDSSLPPRRQLFPRRRAFDGADVDLRRAENFGETFTPRPLRPRAATIEVERDHAMLRIRVTREVRLGEDDEAGDAAGRREEVELRLVDGMEIEVADESLEELSQRADARQQPRITFRGI